MGKQKVLNQVRNSPSSIFNKEDVINLIEQVDVENQLNIEEFLFSLIPMSPMEELMGELMGGKKIFEERLDQLFREDLGRTTYELNARFPDFTGIVGQFSMGNEPSFHIPYLYNFTNSPWKTQKKIRMLLNTWFKDNIFGIPGDEDGGGMSAFVVFSAMGFYPITPGIPAYTIGSPLFSKVTINLPNGKKFIVNAPNCSETNKYVQKVFINGKEIDRLWFTHNDIINGGIITLEMGKYPNKQLANKDSSIFKVFNIK
jgi:predicted alpha-1,2-mannosidase